MQQVQQLGLILTSARSLSSLARHVAAGRCDVLKVVTGWGLPGGWDEASRHAAARLAPALIVRTVAGDPSVQRDPRAAGGYGPHALPVAERVVAEVAPWWRARDPARPFWIEIGNEPLIDPLPGAPPLLELAAWQYMAHLAAAIDACREAFPGARIIAPAHIENHPIRIGAHADGQRWMTEIRADVLRQCDALGLHAYSLAQYVHGLGRLRTYVGAQTVALTEFALNEALDPVTRADRYAGFLRQTVAPIATIYHLDELGGTDPAHFRDAYRLDVPTLEALAALRAAPPAPPPPPPAGAAGATIRHPEIRQEGFASDVLQWRTAAACRTHLAAHPYAETAAWARGVVVHHTWRPTAAAWRGPTSMQTLARHYAVTNGWPAGPHLFFVAGSPRAAWDGIWQLTPLNQPGVHAREANGHTWGAEFVGDYTRLPWSAPLAELGLGAIAALLDWAALPTSSETVSPHSRWGKPECPGAGVSMGDVRRRLIMLRGR